MKNLTKSATLLEKILQRISRLKRSKTFHSSKYWEKRYSSGGNSGAGSYSNFANFKAEIINAFTDKHKIQSVIEFGCGDGNQLMLANYQKYTGVDVSQTIINLCKEKFRSDLSKTFIDLEEYVDTTADLSLSLDVLFHLVEDEVYDEYMRTLFSASNHYVIIYSSNTDDNTSYEGKHVKHRKFTKWIQDNESNWKQIEYIPNRYPYNKNEKTGSFADFYIFEKD